MKLIKKLNKKNKGFTLVELIVVIAILAVLAASAVIAYSNIAENARRAGLNADAQAICRALNTYNALVTPNAARIVQADVGTVNGNPATDAVALLAALSTTTGTPGAGNHGTVASQPSLGMITMNLGIQTTNARLTDLLNNTTGASLRYDAATLMWTYTPLN